MVGVHRENLQFAQGKKGATLWKKKKRRKILASGKRAARRDSNRIGRPRSKRRTKMNSDRERVPNSDKGNQLVLSCSQEKKRSAAGRERKRKPATSGVFGSDCIQGKEQWKPTSEEKNSRAGAHQKEAGTTTAEKKRVRGPLHSQEYRKRGGW